MEALCHAPVLAEQTVEMTRGACSHAGCRDKGVPRVPTA